MDLKTRLGSFVFAALVALGCQMEPTAEDKLEALRAKYHTDREGRLVCPDHRCIELSAEVCAPAVRKWSHTHRKKGVEVSGEGFVEIRGLEDGLCVLVEQSSGYRGGFPEARVEALVDAGSNREEVKQRESEILEALAEEGYRPDGNVTTCRYLPAELFRQLTAHERGEVRIVGPPECMFRPIHSEDGRLAVGPSGERSRMVELYEAKLANADYVAWKNRPGLPEGHQSFPEEAEIQRHRAELARAVEAPEGVEIHLVPLVSGAPTIDGRIADGEWEESLDISTGTEIGDSRLLLRSDGERLYLASDVPGDSTAAGFDQFRFSFHVELCPEIVREWVSVSPGREPNSSRETRIRWAGSATDGDDSWKSYDIMDWRILAEISGATAMNPHRQYEASIDLEEAGLHRGIPFRAFARIETDPPPGSRNERRYIGRLGTQAAPAWLQIGEEGS